LKEKPMDRHDPKYINREEKELMQDIGKMDVRKLKHPNKQVQGQLIKAARVHLAKELKMNIRIDPYELGKIKEKAEMEGLKYQTLVKSVLHKYVTGQLVEKGKKAI
jgi:predicted DNA binding CopG/RHH family protein